MQIRLDKWLANMGYGSRKEVAAMIREGRVMVDGQVVTVPKTKVDTAAQVTLDQESSCYQPYVYYLLNKPAGYLSATQSPAGFPTVLDLIAEGDRRQGLFPVGRLDKDSRGLLLISNDGRLAHALLSPKRRIPKTYQVQLDQAAGPADIQAFAEGFYFAEEGILTQPAQLHILEDKRAQVTIYEGKYHQVKRMFALRGLTVLDLQRLSMGTLRLDPDLAEGAYRPLTEAELAGLQALAGEPTGGACPAPAAGPASAAPTCHDPAREATDRPEQRDEAGAEKEEEES